MQNRRKLIQELKHCVLLLACIALSHRLSRAEVLHFRYSRNCSPVDRLFADKANSTDRVHFFFLHRVNFGWSALNLIMMSCLLGTNKVPCCDYSIVEWLQVVLLLKTLGLFVSVGLCVGAPKAPSHGLLGKLKTAEPVWVGYLIISEISSARYEPSKWPLIIPHQYHSNQSYLPDVSRGASAHLGNLAGRVLKSCCG
jgi:hypothetical protein